MQSPLQKWIAGRTLIKQHLESLGWRAEVATSTMCHHFVVSSRRLQSRVLIERGKQCLAWPAVSRFRLR